MTSEHANRLIIASLVVTGIVSVGGSFAQGKTPPLRIGFGLLFAGTALAVGAEVAPEVAGSFAGLLLATSLFLYGAPALKAITALLGRGAPASTPSGGGSSAPHVQ